jgi:4-amino-4-deoxy-L-arabinose transferase-like glycosyltransferase
VPADADINPMPASPDASSRDARAVSARRGSIVLIVLVWAAVFLPWIGGRAGGFSNTEGFRVGVAWSMLDRDDFLRQELLEQPYLRKPPGIGWVIAPSTALLGRNELAARLPSALSVLGMALMAFAFVRRWGEATTFWVPPLSERGELPRADESSTTGRSRSASTTAATTTQSDLARTYGPLIAALAAVLSPVLWEWGRSAEIEAPCAAMTMLAMLASMHTLLLRHTGVRLSLARSATWASLIAIGLAGSALLKGPAMLPLIAAAVLGVIIATRRASLLASVTLWCGVVLGSAISAGLLWLVWQATRGPETITQGPGEFLWDASRLGDIALLPITTLAATLPASVALLFAFRRSSGTTVTLALALGALLWLVGMWLAGISNTRYVQPVVILLVPLAGLVAARWLAHAPNPAIAARHLRGVGAIVLAMLIGAQVFMYLTARSRIKNSGLEVGRWLASQVASAGDTRPAVILMDEAVEARPEFGLYAMQLSREAAPQQPAPASNDPVLIRAIWNRALVRQVMHDPNAGITLATQFAKARIYLLTVENATGGEWHALQQQSPPPRVVGRRRLHQWDLVLVELTP